MLTYTKLLFTALFWGGTFIAGRVVSRNIPPFSAAFLRFAIASVILLVIVRHIEGRLPSVHKHQILPLILLGLTGILTYNFFFFKGLKFIAAGRASLIVATNPIFVTVLAAVFLRERLNWLIATGVLLSVLGAGVVISRGQLAELTNGSVGWGELYIFGCVISWVAYTLIGRWVMKELPALTTVAYSSAIGTLALLLPAFFEGVFENLASHSKYEWFSLFYLGFFGVVLGFLWYSEGVKKIGASKASQFINFVPISAIVFGFLILSEPVTSSLLGGAALVISGVYLTNFAKTKSK
jgi:drug/metabolite transporter (DMT)-like permease